jgi:hypothetical protein
MTLVFQGPGKARAAGLAGCCLAAALIALGVWVATRPVGDQRSRHHATDEATGSVVRVGKSWDGAQVVTARWRDRLGNSRTSRLEVDVTPPYAVDEDIDLVYDPAHPGSTVLVADPSLSNDGDYRINAGFQSAVVFAFAGVALATLVIWPNRQSSFFSEESQRPVRRAMRRYLWTPIVVSALTVAAAMAVQDLSSNAENVDGFAGLLTLLTVISVIWLGVRLWRRRGLVRLMTIPDDAADNHAVIGTRKRRRLRITTRLSDRTDAVTPHSQVAMVALAGQNLEMFYAGQPVRRYGRWRRRGPTLISSNTGEMLLIGFGKDEVWVPPGRPAPAT